MRDPSGEKRGCWSGPSRDVSVRSAPLAVSTAITSVFITSRSAFGPRMAENSNVRASGLHDSGPKSSNRPNVSCRAAPPSAATTNNSPPFCQSAYDSRSTSAIETSPG